jgi:Phage integrase, N-terminal SAM-like domain
MGAGEIQAFLTHLAAQENVAASTQNQALNALVFLCRKVLNLLAPVIKRSIETQPRNRPRCSFGDERPDREGWVSSA